ncbi:type II toxin-antitoxin system RelE/ParE family toxin [Pseudomonas nicosulfuronedens]|uniref:Type II toxin-antitoxin system RelE/ParE family toxin n=1 Tax=Pseudomonas nicosulfuronedens TaxID=2571105 RepID=A0A5R9QLU4_9PSED|nr:type II toxin-antitoxin system RelE/ParE family toxin [Pseudomonas nicosulfuronedens]MDH1011704.1 type II toxin-antitoxin system RelE/ParE family toxin [Pseudomonas nicosulfuronedens]MDH1980494.1 type II toxin-antitoxin system RelE/ParE family toxin [Pseudomonas nicosulfuronedens]MDH2027444.1 type II toxin-antitoxin system RelE/ParE family toxin [Pseudomonas nicosulfuronedens]TLX70464.1 type II toxin-antitoxin system RelE/ParE family toxin [Pseudomonas nicosulfuronedens]
MRRIESAQFRSWLQKLKDNTGRARIVARINRLLEGLPGDMAPVGKGVSELRIHHGPGYRVYFHQQGDTLLILLCGGDKSSQSRDIEAAQQMLAAWRKQHD